MRGWIVLSLVCASCAGLRAAPADEPPAREEMLSDVVQLTHDFDKAGEAYFSPDMNWIIFQASPKGQQQYQMYVARLKRDADGRITGAEQPTQISGEPSRNTCGYFSPDGRSLLFASTVDKEKPDEPNSGYQRQGGNYRWAFPDGMDIFLADDWQPLVEKAGAGGKVDLNHQRTTHRLTDNNVYDAECAFSPDGKWICFTSFQDKNQDVYVMRIDRHTVHTQSLPGGGHLSASVPVAGTPIRITTAPGYDGGPFFSPDGKRLVYRSDRKGNDLLQVFVADLAFDDKGDITGVKEEHQITNDANVNWGPYWHPDGHHIIFATSRHGHTNYELYLMRDDGSHATRVTNSPGADILPVFSPDGKYLMWTSKRSKDQTSQVFVARFTMKEE